VLIGIAPASQADVDLFPDNFQIKYIETPVGTTRHRARCVVQESNASMMSPAQMREPVEGSLVPLRMFASKVLADSGSHILMIPLAATLRSPKPDDRLIRILEKNES
jgi:hypothetical protein